MYNRQWFEEWGTQMFVSNEERAKKVLAKMTDVYEEASQAIQDDINVILGAVISRNKLDITPQDLRKRLSKAEVRTWKKTVEQYMEEIAQLGGRDTVQGQALWMELEYLSALTRISRLEALQMSIDANMARVAALAEVEIAEHLRDVFKDDYYANMYSYYLMDVPAVNALMETSGVVVTNSYVQQIVNASWVGMNPYSARLWKNEYNAAFRMTDAVAQVLISGRSPSAVAAEIGKRNGFNIHELEKLILTETAHVKTEADKYSYQQAGFTEVEWCATLDKHTCADCRPLDGERIEMKELIAGVNQPPAHTNCRCCLLPVSDYLVGLEKNMTFTRFARDENGEEIWVDGKMTYFEWRKKYGKAKR